MQSTYTKWLRWAIVGGLFASLFIPFIIANGSLFPNMFFPFITGKNFTFRILVEILFGLYVILALREPKYRPRFSWTLAAVGAWVVWAGVADLMSVDPVKSLWSNFERMEGFITVFHLGLYFLVASAVITAEDLWTRFLQTSVGASVLMAGYALLQLGGRIGIDQGSSRVDGTLGNAAYMAIYMLFNIFFALFLLVREWNNRTSRFVYGIILALDTIVLLYTQTRGTVLGLVGGLMMAGIYLIISTRTMPEYKKARTAARNSLIAIVALIALFVGARNVPAIRDSAAFGRLASISLSDKTTESRFMIWHMAWDGFKEKPVFGWGQDNFNYVFNKYYDPRMWDQEQWFDRAHNAFIDWSINGGLLGFLTFIALFGAAGLALWRTRELSALERAALVALIAGYAIHELFVFDDLISYVQFFTILALAHGLSQREIPANVAFTRPVSNEAIAILAPIIAVVVLGGAWALNAPGIANATGLITAITPPQSASGLDQNLAAFKTILAGSPLGRQETVEQLLQFAPQVAQSQAASPEIKQAFYQSAHDAITAMTTQRKGDARLELFFGAFLDSFGQYQEALPHLLAAQEASPKKQQILFEIGQNNLMRSGDTKDALLVLQQAYQLDPSYDTALIYYVSALYQSGDDAQADALLMKRFGTTTPDNATLLQAYAIAKLYTRAEAIIATRLASNPHDAQSWLQYAAMFYASGDTAGTIAALNKGAAADPTFATQAQQLISQLQGGK